MALYQTHPSRITLECPGTTARLAPGRFLLDGATAKHRVARVAGSDPILCALQRVMRDANVAPTEAAAMSIAPARKES